MTAPAAGPRALRIAWWTLSPLVALWFYWLALKTWFVADDFAWLNHATEFYNLREFLRAVFEPMAQGTIRPWSDRLFFIVFYRLFGLDALPFHILVMATQLVNIVLLLSIARRLTGSLLAAFAAALFWIFNTSQPMAFAWTSAFNQPLCAFFILTAFHLLLRYFETGRRRYWRLQWIAFLLGFGALELNVVYPALAISYTFLFAKKHFRSSLLLAVPSILYAIVHRAIAPPAAGLYGMHFGAPMLKTLATYWQWALGPKFLATMIPLEKWLVSAATIILTVVLLGGVVWRARQGDRIPLFGLAWFLIAIAPVLPLSEHLTEYYPFLATIGLAITAGSLVGSATRRSAPRWQSVITAALSITYLAFSIPAAHRTLRWQYERSRQVRKVVLGVERAHQLHPNKVILLDAVTDETFWSGIVDNPFPLVGAHAVYLTPGTEKQIVPHPANGDPAKFLIPPGPTWNVLTREEAVVYSAAADRLRNITSIYTAAMPPEWRTLLPSRVDVANPADAYILGRGWWGIEVNHRWMTKTAAVQLAAPRTSSARLHLSGAGGPASTRIMAAIDGIDLDPRPIAPSQEFDLEWPVPAATVGKPSLTVVISTDRAGQPSEFGRELGLVFGVIEIRE